jgi:hypothetical protein
MTGDFWIQVGRKGSDACFDVSAAMVEAWQLLPHTYKLQIHNAAARLRAVRLGGVHQLGAQASSLQSRINR